MLVKRKNGKGKIRDKRNISHVCFLILIIIILKIELDLELIKVWVHGFMS